MSSCLELQSQRAEQPKHTNTRTFTRTFLLSIHDRQLRHRYRYRLHDHCGNPTTPIAENPTTIIAESPTAIFTKNPTTATVESPTTIIADSPITNITEIPILRPFPGRRDGSGCQTEERRYITGRNEVPLSAVFKGSKTEGRGGIAKVTQPDPLWDRRLKSKPSNLEGRLDKLERTVDHLNPTEPYIVHRLGALEKRVDNLEIAAGEMRDTIKGVQNDISGLQRAKDKTLAYIHKELEKLKNGSATRPANISVKLDFS